MTSPPSPPERPERLERPVVDASFVPRLARKARLKVDRHSGEVMLLYPERGLALNGTAAEIARLCDGARSIADIVAELARAHAPADSAEIEADVARFVSDLRDRGLLERP